MFIEWSATNRAPGTQAGRQFSPSVELVQIRARLRKDREFLIGLLPGWS